MAPPAIYRRRRPRESALYQCLEQYREEFKQAYTLFYQKDYGPLRRVVERTVERFLECGILRHGFARIRCGNCREEYLPAFSRKTRYFRPSRQAKRVAVFVESITEQILEAVDHRQLVWTLPRVLRPTFRRDRRLLGELARCAWKTLQDYSRTQSLDRAAAPGAIVAIHTYGDIGHLNLREQPRRAPPPPLLPHKLDSFPATLSPRRRQQVRASTDSVFRDEVPVHRG